jgi:serine/threonine protein kinase
MKKIFEAFVYLHENGIAHRDVKLENVLIGTQSKDEIAIKIIDFGFSRQVFQTLSDLK